MVSFVGYETYEYEFEITEKNPNVKIKNIFLNRVILLVKLKLMRKSLFMKIKLIK